MLTQLTFKGEHTTFSLMLDSPAALKVHEGHQNSKLVGTRKANVKGSSTMYERSCLISALPLRLFAGQEICQLLNFHLYTLVTNGYSIIFDVFLMPL